MRIGIEAQRIFRKDKHGMDYVVLHEIMEIQKIDIENEYFVFVAPGEDRCLENTKNVHIIEIGGNFYPLWEQFTLPRAAKKYNLDMLHCTSNTAPIYCQIPIILTLHDIIFLEPRNQSNKSFYQNLGWYYRRIIVPIIINKCKIIITVSNIEMNNIRQTLNIPKEHICMIHNGYNNYFQRFPDYKQVVDKYIKSDKYFFHFANTDPRKNTERTLLAYAIYLNTSTIKRQLLITGINHKQLTCILEKNHIEYIYNNIVLTGYIPGNDLPSIYNGSFALLFASLREGFGIPILEAMSCGTPVITSNTSSMPEIGGEDAILVNPKKSDEIAEMMLLLEKDDLFYQKQVEYGIQRAQLFSWRKTAEQLLSVYERIYQQQSSTEEI